MTNPLSQVSLLPLSDLTSDLFAASGRQSTDPFSQLSSLLPSDLTSGLFGTSGQQSNAAGSYLSSFALLLARALIQVAQELQQPAQLNANSILNAASSGAGFESISSGALSLGQPVAPGIATRAYQTSSGWSFIPVYIPPGAAELSAPASQNVAPPAAARPISNSQPLSVSAPAAAAAPTPGAMPLAEFPRPAGDNGRGMHWIPTTASTPDVVDRFVKELSDMRVKWAVILNEGADATRNDYLVQQLTANGIEPIMRVLTPGLQPLSGDLGAMVRHYKALGVNYFQLYNEPNHEIENDGQAPDVKRYLDLWIPAAKIVAANGGLPGFGALSPGGPAADSPKRVDDLEFLPAALKDIKARGETGVLDRAWLSAHNYMGDKPLANPDGLLRVQRYEQIIKDELGRSMPIIGTEGGSFVGGSVNEAVQMSLVTSAMRYMKNSREPYNFAYSYWVLANSLGGGKDPSWEWQALFQPDHTSPIVDVLKSW